MTADRDDARDWVSADQAHVWHPYTQMRTAPAPIPITRAEGVYLFTQDGRRILDGISSWWVNIHGHNHPRLNAALARQASALAQVVFAGLTHEPAARLAAALARRAPGDLPRVFYSDDGSTAVEVALKMAYQLWRNRGVSERRLFVALEHAYHGDTFGAMAIGGVPAFHGAFRDLFFEVRRAAAPCCDPRFRALARTTCPVLGAPSIDEVLEREGDRVAAVIIEPMLQGAGGMLIWPREYLLHVREATRRRGIPLIADEVLTGFGRTGKLFACEHGPIEPDILCVSKALTGGYLPLSATLATREIYEAFLGDEGGLALLHGHSYTANALACAVALESLALFDEEPILERVARLEGLFRQRAGRLERLHGVRHVRSLGGLLAVEIAPRGEGGYFDAIGPALGRELLRRDILLRPLGSTLYFLPPYCITDAETSRVLDNIEEALAEALQDR